MRLSPISTSTDVCQVIESALQEIPAHGGIPIGVPYAEGVDWETLAIEFAPAAYWAAQQPDKPAIADRLIDDRLHHLDTLPPDAILLGVVGLHPRGQLVATYIGIALDLLQLTPHELEQHVIQHYRSFRTDLTGQRAVPPGLPAPPRRPRGRRRSRCDVRVTPCRPAAAPLASHERTRMSTPPPDVSDDLACQHLTAHLQRVRSSGQIPLALVDDSPHVPEDIHVRFYQFYQPVLHRTLGITHDIPRSPHDVRHDWLTPFRAIPTTPKGFSAGWSSTPTAL